MTNSVSHQTPLFRDFPDKNIEMGCHFPFHNIYLTRGLNTCLLHRQMDSLSLSHQGGLYMYQFSSFQSLSRIRLFVTTWTAVHLASLSITNSQSLLKFMSIESVMLSTISSSVVPFFSCLRSFPASVSFISSQFFTSGGESIGTSASASVLPMTFRNDFL